MCIEVERASCHPRRVISSPEPPNGDGVFFAVLWAAALGLSYEQMAGLIDWRYGFELGVFGWFLVSGIKCSVDIFPGYKKTRCLKAGAYFAEKWLSWVLEWKVRRIDPG